MNLTEINQTLSDLQVIALYKQGDRFAVQKGRLILDRQRVWQGPMRVLKNILFGGYNRNDVTNYMEGLANRVELLSQDQLEQNAQQLIRLSSAISDIQYLYRPELFSFQSKEPSKRMDKVYDRIKKVTKELKFSHPPETDFNQLDLFDPTYPSSFEPPKGIEPKRISQLSEELNRRSIGKIKRVAIKVFMFISSFFIGFLLTPINCLKFWIWNPIELLCRGEIRTENPVLWAASQLSKCYESFSEANTKAKMEKYASWLLQGEEVTDAHLKAFEELPWIGEKLDLDYFAVQVENLEEIKLALQGDTKSLQLIENNDELRKSLQERLKNERINFLNLQLYLSLRYIRNAHIDLPKIRNGEKSLTYSQLKYLITIAVKHEECREIKLPYEFERQALSFLEQAGFRKVRAGTYRR